MLHCSAVQAWAEHALPAQCRGKSSTTTDQCYQLRTTEFEKRYSQESLASANLPECVKHHANAMKLSTDLNKC